MPRISHDDEEIDTFIAGKPRTSQPSLTAANDTDDTTVINPRRRLFISFLIFGLLNNGEVPLLKP